MRSITLALCILITSSSIYAQDSSRKAKRMARNKTIQADSVRMNPRSTPMNANGNPTPTYNSTRPMNEPPARPAATTDTTKR